MRARTLKIAAAMTASALVLLSAGPGAAAGPVAQASATALTVTIGGTPTDSGTYRVTNDGKRETATGSNEPAVAVLGGQTFLTGGTLAQDATTRVVDGQGSSAACAGLAGDGATLVEVGEGACLTPGQNVTLNAGALDFDGLQIVEGNLPQDLPPEVQAALDTVQDDVLDEAQTALQDVLEDLGNPGLFLEVGAIQSQCTAGPGATAAGDAQLAGVSAYAQLPNGGQRFDLVAFPVNPPPNTKLVTDLDEVVTAITDGLETQLETAFDGALSPASPEVTQIKNALNENLIAAIKDQLAPLEENVLDGTLNKQVRSPGAIEVTAVDVEVLPAAAEAAGMEVLSTQIGRSSCGPGGSVSSPPRDAPRPPPADPELPTSVPAGLTGSEGSDNGLVAAVALSALVALSGLAGVAAYRRSLRP